MDSYLKGIAFYITISAFTVKTALDATGDLRKYTAVIGMMGSIAALFTCVYGFILHRRIKEQFIQLSLRLSTVPVETFPFLMVVVATGILWTSIVAGYVMIYFFGNTSSLPH